MYIQCKMMHNAQHVVQKSLLVNDRWLQHTEGSLSLFKIEVFKNPNLHLKRGKKTIHKIPLMQNYAKHRTDSNLYPQKYHVHSLLMHITVNIFDTSMTYSCMPNISISVILPNLLWRKTVETRVIHIW